MGLATRCETRTSTLRAKLYKPASEKEVVTTKKQPLAQRPLLQDNLTQGQHGETNANKNLPAPITQLPVTGRSNSTQDSLLGWQESCKHTKHNAHRVPEKAAPSPPDERGQARGWCGYTMLPSALGKSGRPHMATARGRPEALLARGHVLTAPRSGRFLRRRKSPKGCWLALGSCASLGMLGLVQFKAPKAA